MSYEIPTAVISYSFGEIDFGAGDVALEIKGLSGKKGRLVDIHVAATETFNSVTTEADVLVGTADPDEFGDLAIGDLATDTAINASQTSGSLKTDSNGQSVLIDGDEDVQVACTAPTGGTPAGKAHVTIVIAWF